MIPPRSRVPLAFALTIAAGLGIGSTVAESFRAVAKDGHPLNLDFETGDLRDWTVEGAAFNGQPIRGDVVAVRRGDMKSQHTGSFWIGGFEKVGDDPQGTLTSASFVATQPWASFLFAGGPWPNTRIELVEAASGNVFFKVSGLESESLRPFVVDLEPVKGREIFIRLVDRQSGHWGHVNFDDFRLHSERPKFASEVTVAELQKNTPPPADTVAFAGLSPEKAVAAITLPAGFTAHVFAAEPDVKQPIAFCDDDRGRLWVVEGYTYPRRVGNPPKVERVPGADPTKPTAEQLKDIFGGKDRILVFEDTDGDHRFDKRTVFAENLNLVSGIEYGFGGVWVGAAPYLMFIPIADGDAPKPAGEPRLLLDGWNYTADTHEVLNTFTWGPDGWLYGCHGVFCPSNVGRPGAAEQDRQWMDAGVWRYHPVKHQFEVFTEGGSNPWGVDFDEHGQCWAEMCVIPHLFHMIQGARITRQGGEHFCYNRDEAARNAANRDARSRKPVFPYVYEDISQHADHVHYAGNQGPHAANGRSDAAGGGHAHAGMLCYLGAGWPSEYRGKLIIGNIHGQRLNVDIPVAEGSGYVGHHGADFLNFNDTWSQTLNQRYDADGSLFVIDWYDKNQCHHNNVDGHDRSNGRIYKVVYQNQPRSKVDLAKLSDDELVKLVPSKNEWMSRHARRILQERIARASAGETPENVPAEFEQIVKLYLAGEKMPGRAGLVEVVENSKDTTARLRALWALHLTGGLSLEHAGRWVRDPDPWVRSWVVQLFFENAGALFASGRAADLAEKAAGSLAELAREDRSPVARRFVASALQRIPPRQRWDALTELAKHSEDASDHNLPYLYWYAAEGSVATEPARGLELLKTCQIPKLREFIARRLATMAVASAK